MRRGRCEGGGDWVRGRKISKRAKREFRACWEICLRGLAGGGHGVGCWFFLVWDFGFLGRWRVHLRLDFCLGRWGKGRTLDQA